MRRAVQWLVAYALAVTIVFGAYWVVNRYEALVGLRMLWVLFGWAATVWWIWRFLLWVTKSIGATSWKFGLPWQCVLRGHAVLHRETADIPTDDGNTMRIEAWVRRSCRRCSSYPRTLEALREHS